MDTLGERLAQLFDQPEALAFVLLLARIGPVVLFSPLFGGASAPWVFRLGLGAAFAAVFTPLMGPLMGSLAVPAGGAALPMLAAKELLIGATLAVLISAVFGLFAASGTLIDRARGEASATAAGQGTHWHGGSRLNVFFRLFFVTIFLAAGGHRLLFAAFGEGLIRVPLGGSAGAGFALGSSATVQIASLTGELFAAALQLALPVIAISLTVDLALGLLNRAAGPIGAFFLGLSVKGILGAATVLFLLGVGAEEFLGAALPLVRRLAELR